MVKDFTGIELPKNLDEVNAAFMTNVLRHCGVIEQTNEVLSIQEAGVGLTAGYFSAIKKVKCTYKNATRAQDSFVVKTWPSFEILPKEVIKSLFIKDIKAYSFPAERFFPRPKSYLASFDEQNYRFALLMEDVDTFAEHKVHENEMSLAEVMKLLPRLVDVAVAWEGCHEGELAKPLDELGVNLWTSEANLAVHKAKMPEGAKLYDKWTMLAASWHKSIGGADLCEMLTSRLDAFFRPADPAHGATCTLAHGDFRGDNIFLCEGNPNYPDGWLCIDFQLMFRGPIPTDLAYLMNSASVLPEVYKGESLKKVLRSFYDQFMAKTRIYKGYTYEQFEREYATMTAVLLVYYISMGAAFWQAGAFNNQMGACIELGGKGATEADLSPEDLRRRMWWLKVAANFRETFIAFNQYEYIKSLPENVAGLGKWTELPAHLR